MSSQQPSHSTATAAALPAGTTAATTPPNTKLLQPSQLQPARPYTRIRLTVEPNGFVLRPYQHTASTTTGATPSSLGTSSALPAAATDLVRVLFKPAQDEQIERERANDGINSLSGLAIGQSSRVSFLSSESYVPSDDARDYLIYGCIGLLDLHTGPHFIVVTSVRSLGDIEDKSVSAIEKVAVLPMDAQESRQVLDRLAHWIDPSAGPIDHPRQLSDQQSSIQESVTEDNGMTKDTAVTSDAAVTPPKIRFSFLGLRQDKGLLKTSPSTTLPTPANSLQEAPIPANPSSSRKISFDIPRLGARNKSSTSLVADKSTAANTTGDDALSSTASSPPSSPQLSPRTQLSQSGFFAKLKENVLDMKPRKSIDGTSPPPSLSTLDTNSSAPAASKDDLGQHAIVAAEPRPVMDPAALEIDVDGPLPAPRSPSAFEAAERFMVESTKQIASWSEEAVSGVLKTSLSLTATKQTSDGENSQHERTTSLQESEESEMEKDKALDRRIIREISSIFGNGFYFSTEFNLLSSKQKRSDAARDKAKADALLWQQVDRRFWWNEHLQKEFLDIEANGYILPVMQGYVEMAQCVIEEQPFEFTLISRRSRERSGLRYQRRGIDEEGHTANFVETEQLLRIVRDDSDHQVSFVQTRGSIPLFWSQSPYRLKPIPILERSEQENEEGFKKHIDSLINQYGRQILINLVEQHGRELIAGSAYSRYVEKLAEPSVRYVDFDFHEQCRGMKYENIDRLIESLETPILELGYCWLAPRDNGPKRERNELFERLYDQKGVIRTNCMDCLDRTNVVQSAIGRYILNHQLLRLGIASFPDKGLSVYEDFENVFNNVWANNGDAISREYAGTSALKGDFTRTGKRNLQGMINDATNSMARMYQNTFKDYFRQAAIDYLLGVDDVNVFKNLQTTPFGTVIVPPPILPPTAPESSEIKADSLAATDPSLDANAAGVNSAGADVLLPSLMPHSSISPSSTSDERIIEALEEKALQQATWVKIREAAIETSAEIVISPGEKHWKGWTFICSSNEINSSLTSASSPQSSPLKKARAEQEGETSNSNNADSASKADAVFYDEKVVLLTERALYICTYDYEMEKVVEFWRLALEKMTGIDKGAYFLTAQDKTPISQDPLENYGFAVIYRASAEGETLRVNSGSMRNRRMMGMSRTGAGEFSSLGRVQEVDEESASAIESGHDDYNESNDQEAGNDRSAHSLLQGESNEIRSVRFKIVKHPETSIVPFVTSSTTDEGQSKANPSGYRRTAQDCVEWVVTEIVQARCELISVAEQQTTAAPSAQAGLKTPPGQLRQLGLHGRSPSEEYNYYSPREKRRPSVQVDLVIRDRELQNLETADRLEKEVLALQQNKSKRIKKPFASFFTSSSSKIVKEQSGSSSSASGANNGNGKSWLKKLQFGMNSDDDSDEDEANLSEALDTKPKATVADGQGSTSATTATPLPSNSNISSRTSNQGVFAKLKLAVKKF
ncbi:hypothetical protein BGZ99_004090 [Dissophora globulifera]|uniref:SAC domain-containing protein n=1 Tax=Dissophora globulifera TaxID=979702 RepID=A0A9P6UV92_9FUNG|nr:hypothetical protein BGZ99_004090 [Dissophora globulifera]